MQKVEARNIPFNVTESRQAAFWGRVTSGHWEPATFTAIASRLTPETVVLDFGAWIGPVTLFAAAQAKTVHAFEPDPVAATELRENIALNPDLATRITVHERAVWPEPGTVRLGAKTAQGDSMSSVHHTASATSWEVATITPAEIADLLPKDAPVFVKIDTEGAEYAIVPQLAGILARPKLAALVSFHPRFAAGGHPRFHKTFPMTKRIFDMFRGFKIYRVHKDRIARAWLLEALNALGLAWFEAKTSYLFVRD